MQVSVHLSVLSDRDEEPNAEMATSGQDVNPSSSSTVVYNETSYCRRPGIWVIEIWWYDYSEVRLARH